MQKKIITYEDHFIMMLWERHLTSNKSPSENIELELNNLSMELISLRKINQQRFLSLTEKSLLKNINLMTTNLTVGKQHLISIKKIKKLLNSKKQNGFVS
ncbi:hypothetical protein [Vibrio sp. OPT18]|uniref:hypothetical protein n=1 Tax=Vibrio sp. OPT18 TaxID=2778641 RepID=UPI00187EAAA5|nr:hypothetical protein [Vibrio sp. OPT18]MBE8576454.1 hypothetical protein [Vibrio sp. OPT18]